MRPGPVELVPARIGPGGSESPSENGCSAAGTGRTVSGAGAFGRESAGDAIVSQSPRFPSDEAGCGSSALLMSKAPDCGPCAAIRGMRHAHGGTTDPQVRHVNSTKPESQSLHKAGFDVV